MLTLVLGKEDPPVRIPQNGIFMASSLTEARSPEPHGNGTMLILVDITSEAGMLKARKKGGDSMSNHCIREVAEA